MAKTGTEELLIELKRASRSKSVLVPLIENFMRSPVEVEDDEDRDYLAKLIEARSQPRRKDVYSPSMLSSCVRQVYLSKKGVKKKKIERISSNGYFVEGNFRHYKWQFVSWKMHRAGIIKLIDVGSICIGSEIYVHNNRGDFGGTIDTLMYIPTIDEICTVDWKGMNGNNFMQAVAKNAPPLRYAVQISGYASLANGSLDLPQKINRAIIVYENKMGAVTNRMVRSPLGLKEFQVDIDLNRKEIARRLKTLRAAERKDEMPPAECVSTHRVMFKDCPFSSICRAEVEKSERKLLKLRNKDENKPKVQFTRKRT